jgi:hypothetical protein
MGFLQAKTVRTVKKANAIMAAKTADAVMAWTFRFIMTAPLLLTVFDHYNGL